MPSSKVSQSLKQEEINYRYYCLHFQKDHNIIYFQVYQVHKKSRKVLNLISIQKEYLTIQHLCLVIINNFNFFLQGVGSYLKTPLESKSVESNRKSSSPTMPFRILSYLSNKPDKLGPGQVYYDSQKINLSYYEVITEKK